MMMADEDPEVETVQALPVAAAPGKEAKIDLAPNQEGGEDSDPELDQLLDQSLGEFGKHTQAAPHVPTTPCAQQPVPPNEATPPPPGSSSKPVLPPLGSAEMEELFSSEFAAEAEAQLDEAMKMFSSQNPELWQQFETFAKSMGLDEMAAGMGPAPPHFGAASKGESSSTSKGGGSSVDAAATAEATTTTTTAAATATTATATAAASATTAAEAAAATGQPKAAEGSGTGDNLDKKLEETIKRMQENASDIGPESNHLGDLGDMLGQLDLGSEEGEDHFMKMMQGMMSTLLSKEVLYPSLLDMCKQYPEWLASHRGSLSEQDYQRYSKQLEIMRAICQEFEGPSPGGEGSSSEKILGLMQELQQYGQPPEDMAGENMQQAGIPPGLQNLLKGPPDPNQNCVVM